MTLVDCGGQDALSAKPTLKAKSDDEYHTGNIAHGDLIYMDVIHRISSIIVPR